MDIIAGAVVALAAAAMGFLAGRVVVGKAPEVRLPGRVDGYYPTEDELEVWRSGQEGE